MLFWFDSGSYTTSLTVAWSPYCIISRWGTFQVSAMLVRPSVWFRQLTTVSPGAEGECVCCLPTSCIAGWAYKQPLIEIRGMRLSTCPTLEPYALTNKPELHCELLNFVTHLKEQTKKQGCCIRKVTLFILFCNEPWSSKDLSLCILCSDEAWSCTHGSQWEEYDCLQ